MIYARQSTAIIVTVGPCLDADGVADTGVVVGAFLASKNGGAPAALNASATLTHRNTGHYSLSLTATDVNTVGTVEIVINDTTTACPIKEIQVVEPATYDVLFADAAPGPASPTNITAGTLTTVTTATNVTTVNGLAANVITAAATAADFGTEVGTAVWATGTRVLTANTNLNDPTAAAIADAVWDEDATAHQTGGTFGQAIGDPAADTNTIYGAVVTGAAGATVAADIVAVKADTAAILADTGTDGVVVAAASKTGYTLSSAGLADFFDTDSGTTYASAVAGSVVKEIADNAGGSALTAAAIADAVWDEAQADHVAVGSFGITASEIADILTDTAEIGAAGAGLTAINLPDQTMNITGNITGNLTGSVGSVTGAVGSVTGAVGSVTGLTASDVGAIKAKTDSLTFTVAGQADANIQYVNDVAVAGDGQAGTEWGP